MSECSWNHRIIRAVRFWSAEDHIDETVLAALTEGSTDQLREEGTGSELLEQLRRLWWATAGLFDLDDVISQRTN